MLRQLELENIALVDKMVIPFDNGLNLLTGETGAGKSVIINSLKLVLGGRLSGDEVKRGRDKGFIQAIFSPSFDHPLWERLEEYSLGSKEDEDVILAREINTSGKNLCRINGRVVTLGLLKEVGSLLVDIQGQHEQHSILKVDNHLKLLDSFGDEEFIKLKENYKETYGMYKEHTRKLTKLNNLGKDKARKIDMLEYQIKEIVEANLVIGEEEALMAEKLVLANSERLALLSDKSYQNLYKGQGHQASVLDLLGEIVNNLKEISKMDLSLEGLRDNVENTFYQLEEASREIKNYHDNIEFNPQRLEDIEDKLALISQLSRKYGDKIEEILEFKERASEELALLLDQEIEVEVIGKKISALETDLIKLTKSLKSKRQEIATKIEKAIIKELTELEMPKVKFRIRLEETSDYNEDGKDSAEFLIATNVGEDLKSLSKVASGGEMSRIFLALKIVLVKEDNVFTLVFDEIDTGLGGQGVLVVADKLDLLARSKQVICITHSPQIAGKADQHLLVYKEIINDGTQSFIKQLNYEEKIFEIARMMSGKKITETTVKHAKEIIEGA